MNSHKDLEAWKNSIDLVFDIYNLTRLFPKEEIFGLTQQLRRAIVSVPSNISEGAARNQKREFIRFLRISSGSLAEAETQLLIAYRQQYFSSYEMTRLSNNIKTIRIQISGLIRSLEQ